MDVVTMSAKGQVVIPQTLREQEGVLPGDRFFVVKTPEGFLFRKADLRKLYDEFRKLSGEVQREVKKRNIPPSVVDEAIRWARKKS